MIIEKAGGLERTELAAVETGQDSSAFQDRINPRPWKASGRVRYVLDVDRIDPAESGGQGD